MKIVLTKRSSTLDGQPVWRRFEKVINGARRKLLMENPAGLRAYGDIVGVLWKAGQYSAAIRSVATAQSAG